VDLNHLHLHVRDQARSRIFYERWFGFRERVWHGDILFLANDDGFDLALAPDKKPAKLPAWFHVGCRLPTAAKVRALHRRMEAAGVKGLGDFHRYEDHVFFRCTDPDRYKIEVYWEP
jgi:catechol 2,3-dioxygenase-like lactoylglutathione lyase family enzyme